MLKFAIAAVLAVFLTWTSAVAAPQAPSLKIGPAVSHGDSGGLLVEVKKKKWKYHRHKRYKYGKRYKHYGHRRHYRGRYYRYPHYRGHYYRRPYYRRPPAGWYRYHYRPYGWSRRGCIAFGPVWYCP